MRKLIIVLVALTLCLQVFSGTVVYGAVGNNIIVSYENKSDVSTVYQGAFL